MPGRKEPRALLLALLTSSSLARPGAGEPAALCIDPGTVNVNVVIDNRSKEALPRDFARTLQTRMLRALQAARVPVVRLSPGCQRTWARTARGEVATPKVEVVILPRAAYGSVPISLTLRIPGRAGGADHLFIGVTALNNDGFFTSQPMLQHDLKVRVDKLTADLVKSWNEHH